jgi:hypothetical protein
MEDSRKLFLRSLIALFVLAVAIFSAELIFEWLKAGRPDVVALTWAANNNAKLVDLLSPVARAYNNVLAMLIATIGLAIPLTANMHTPKLIDMFLRDPINRAMLTFFALGAANVLWVAYLIGPNFAPMWAFRLAIVGSLMGWVAVIPYFFYVVRFLDPSNILERLRCNVEELLDDVRAGRLQPTQAHDRIQERVHQIGTLILKSIDRADRGTALEGVWVMKRLLDSYGALKNDMPPAWFKVERKDFIGLSPEALELVNEERVWFEHRVMWQVFLAYQVALAKTGDVISALSDATRIVGVRAASRGDERALELVVRFFNTYLREAIKRKDLHATYDLFYQYRTLAEAVCDRPAQLGRIATYFRLYSEQGLHGGLGLLPAFVAFDFGQLVASAYDRNSPAAPALLDELLRLSPPVSDPRLLFVKAKVMLGGQLLQRGLPTEAERLREHLAHLSKETVSKLSLDLLENAERSFWEVTDRQAGLEWSTPETRAHIRSFLEGLGSSNGRAASAVSLA